MTLTSIDEWIDNIEQLQDYKIIKRFKKIIFYNKPTAEKKSIGVFVDVETTGSNANKDHVTEMALVPFEYTCDGKIYRVLDSYVSFNDPGIPIPPNITKLTGITNEMVAGKSFDYKRVEQIIDSASIIIAHHAGFDKKFVEKLFPKFKEKLWGCTVAHIKWRDENISSAKLEYLAYKFGVFYDAHRAEIDSLIGIHILAQMLPVSNKLALGMLLDNVDSQYYKIWAENSPYHLKDILKNRGYRWSDGKNGRLKSWFKIIKESLLNQELEFLYDKIYGRRLDLKVEITNLFK